MNETNRSKFRKRAAVLAVASCISLVPGFAEAAGLGRLTVLSGLGQPLRAELEISSAPDELPGMTARLAARDIFKQAGVDFSSALSDLRFAIDKRPNGQSVVVVSSVRPMNEPFLDFLVELNWQTGRLVREYTFLLDPPEIAVRQAGRQTAEAKPVETIPGGVGVEGKGAASGLPAAGRLAPQPRKKAESAGATHVVKEGETLRRIAAETQHEGVSLEQMLVGLFQNNPDAFIGNNINRLKAGAILGIPEKSAVEAVSQEQARKVYTAHAGDWNAYRQKLAASTASGVAKNEASTQSSTGKIAARVEEKTTPGEQARDQVKVARTDLSGRGNSAIDDAERVATDRALKDAKERLVLLEKQVGDLQKLLDMKSQRLAELQQGQSAKPEAVKPAEVPVSPPVASEPAKAAPEEKPTESTVPVETPKPVEASKPPAPPKKPVPPPPEPEMFDSLLEDPLPLAGGAGVIALLLGYFLVKRRRTGHASLETAALTSTSSSPNSVFRSTGGQSVDTGNTAPQTADFSQAGPGTIDTDDVDPVAEADVYMAYGRDAQAEEILLEALQKDPQRTAIHAKLLEIYASRGSVKQFETLAGEMYAQTGGVGQEWSRVAELGHALDAGNPLYASAQRQVGSAVPAVTEPEDEGDHELLVPETSEPVEESPVALSEELIGEPDKLPDTLTVPEPESFEVPENMAEEIQSVAAGSDEMSLDFDLGSPPEVVAEAEAEAELSVDDDNALDFDLGSELDLAAGSGGAPATDETLVDEVSQLLDFAPIEMEESPRVAVEEADALKVSEFDVPDEVEPLVDFELDINEPSVAAAAPEETIIADEVPAEFELPPVDEVVMEPAVIAEETVEVNEQEFDFEIPAGEQPVAEAEPALPDFDIGSINLDLSAEPPAAEPVAAKSEVEADDSARSAQWEEVNTKLDLAKAYEEMGDLEGARELLQEVVSEGTTDLVVQAREILDRIGG